MIQSLKLRLRIFEEKDRFTHQKHLSSYRIFLYVSTSLTFFLTLCLHSVVQGDCPILSFFFFFASKTFLSESTTSYSTTRPNKCTSVMPFPPPQVLSGQRVGLFSICPRDCMHYTPYSPLPHIVSGTLVSLSFSYSFTFLEYSIVSLNHILIHSYCS